MGDGKELQGLALSVAVGVIGVAVALTSKRWSGGAASPEDVALGAARKQSESGDREGALATVTACMKRDPRACLCVEQAADLAMDLAHYEDAKRTLKWEPFCTAPAVRGLRAEALVATGRTGEGLGAASNLLREKPDEPHASLAKAWALSMSGFSPEALALGEAALRGRRSVRALLLVAKLRAGAGDSTGARAAIEEASRLEPADPRVAFDLGIVEQGEHHYREAREAYLRALSLDPRMADARYQLAVLTHGVQADDEARHHLDELAAIAPNDPRIAPLRATLQSK
jgi:tetratricopeptide (TPR) repeat protein